MMPAFARLAPLAVPMLLGGCSGAQSVLHPVGPDAQRIWQLGALMVIGATAILVIVCIATWIAMRGPATASSLSDLTAVSVVR